MRRSCNLEFGDMSNIRPQPAGIETNDGAFSTWRRASPFLIGVVPPDKIGLGFGRHVLSSPDSYSLRRP